MIQINRLFWCQKSLELLKVADQRGGRDFQVKTQMALVTAAYEKTKKDNDFVYYERVPEYKTLAPIERAAIAKPTPAKFPISEDFKGKEINSSLYKWFIKS